MLMKMAVDEKRAAVKPKACLGVRHLQVLMLFFAMLLSFGMRVNMSMAIVAMTDPLMENSFDWSVKRQSVILSSFFWGYLVLQIPGGVWAAKYGSKLPLTLCVGLNSAISLLIPMGAFYGGWQLVCVCRILQGLAQGFLLPSVHNLIAKWVPVEEKSSLGSMIYSGAQLGTALQLLAAGFIANYWGWPAIFYVNGTLGTIWTLIYVFVGATSPKTSTVISEDEQRYIEVSLGQVGEQKVLKTPWKAIFTSVPFLSLIVAQCGHNWGFWTLMTEIPSYMKQVLGVDIKSNGVLSALPYLAIYIMSFPLGFLADYILKKKWLSITATRKLFNTIGQWGPAFALIGLSYAPADTTIAVAMLTTVVGLNAGHYTGFMLVHIDMSPNFAGTLMGITNMSATFISILAPLVAGAILTDQTDASQWRIVFYLSSAIYFFFNLVFVIFGTSETQKWNDPDFGEVDSGDKSTTPKQKIEKVV